MEIPASLARRIDLFRDGGHAMQIEGELFRVDSWTEVMLGQGIMPRHYHPVAAATPDADLTRLLDALRASISQKVAKLPSQQEFISQYCKASSDVWGPPAS
jgi:tryptophan halogenase